MCIVDVGLLVYRGGGSRPRRRLGIGSLLGGAVLLVLTASHARAVCVGDCNGNGVVRIDELIRGVNIALGSTALDECLALETNSDGRVSVDELITAVNNALRGCSLAPTPTPTPPPANQAPVVDAGDDAIIPLDGVATLRGRASDDGRPDPPGALTLQWTRISGPGTVTFASPDAATTTATASAVGSYRLRLSASDGALIGSDDVMLHVDLAAAARRHRQVPVALRQRGVRWQLPAAGGRHGRRRQGGDHLLARRHPGRRARRQRRGTLLHWYAARAL